MFGFTSAFVPQNEPTAPSTNSVPWKSMSECSKHVRKVGKDLRSLSSFDAALQECLRVLLIMNDTSATQSCKWMTQAGEQRLRDMLFCQLQVVGHIFVANQNYTKSLRTDIATYRRFFADVCRAIDADASHLFTAKQVSMIHLLRDGVLAYVREDSECIVEQQHRLLEKLEAQRSVSVLSSLRRALSAQRVSRCEMVLAQRTDRVLLVLDQCYDVRNQCAMLRSAELLGVQHIWVVAPVNYKNKRCFDSVSRHAQLWLSLRYFASSAECVAALRCEHERRQIWLMDVGKDALELSTQTMAAYRSCARTFPGSVALVMGKEAEGPSAEFRACCDAKVYLPQVGFCESFNVSVACALGLSCLFAMQPQMRGQMDEAERERLRYRWYYQLVNDKQIKLQMQALADKSLAWDEDEDGALGQDFRRNEFKHWDSKKLNCRLRRKIEKQQKQTFLDSLGKE